MPVIFDQHFLKNQEILDITIKYSNITNEDTIYEIGPGSGILTKEILKKNPKQLISIEKDSKMVDFLTQIKKNHNQNFTFEIEKDGVEEINNHNFTKLLANIPYSITEPLYKKLMDNKISFAILLHGNDFYKKICIQNNKWHFFINAFYNINVLKEVLGTDFEPKTKTKSILIKLELKQENSLTKFEKFLQTLYSKKKRNTKNAILYSLVEILELPKKEIKNQIENSNLNLSETSILENISNTEFTEMINTLKSDFFEI